MPFQPCDTLRFPSEKSESKVITLDSLSTLRVSFSATPVDQVSYSALILSTIDARALATALGQPTNASAPGTWRLGNNQISSVTIPLSAKKGGRYRWEWDLSLPNAPHKEDMLIIARLSDGRLKAQLMVAPLKKDNADENTLLMELGTIALTDEEYWKASYEKTKKYPREWEVERYAARPEIAWTFNEPRKPTSPVLAFVGIAAVLSPWLLLVTLVGIASYAQYERSAEHKCIRAGRKDPPFAFIHTKQHRHSIPYLAGRTRSSNSVILVRADHSMDLHAFSTCTRTRCYTDRQKRFEREDEAEIERGE
jgi:hypothetical protein